MLSRIVPKELARLPTQLLADCVNDTNLKLTDDRVLDTYPKDDAAIS
ncbi:hypothetical protein [Candidatus Mesenet endosymbiont of Agriotes lineatus]